ncbi:hypothetical protein KP509_08G047800 [Ceratopteris richardii]|uniref:Plastocyanin n=1 Tax=Ceratopteris richardii TaxID=49495 RepID=A0A8T2UC04_CERRI|nr:hypothetical protein KP509_08G047800 [Ceratopteris richardii]
MASLTAASVAVPSFCGLKAETSSSRSSAPIALVAPVQRPSLSISASLYENVMKASSTALIATTAAALLAAGPALAAKIEVGDEIGSFKFSPATVTVAAGEPIEFTLVGETGHNVVFDVPAGAPAAVASELKANSMDENDLLSEDEPTFTAKVSTPGTYTYYCTPHKSANMVGTVIVK